MRVLICGGGVIGAAIAYFLSCRGVAATVIERTGLACAASGKSGGFLALDWCDGSPLDQLARRSFALHAELPGRIGDDFGYRRMTTYGGFYGGQSRHELGWLSPQVALQQRPLGSAQTTAQVHPAELTQALMRAAERQGAQLRLGEVTQVVHSDGTTRGVVVDGETLEADAVVIAMGPWSILATQWLPLPGVYGLKGHSLVFQTGAQVPAEAVFLEYQEPGGATHGPEIFPRRDGTTYVCAISSESALPIDPAAVAPDPGAIERLETMCARLSPVLGAAPILARQACHRPVTQDGLPLIGARAEPRRRVRRHRAQRLGILNAPATRRGDGRADRRRRRAQRRPVAVRPGRLPAFDPRRLQQR